MQASRAEIEARFQQLCAQEQRCGVIGFVAVESVRLLPEQAECLRGKLGALVQAGGVTAVSLGLFYRETEILAVPPIWKGMPSSGDRWNEYARAYGHLNQALNRVAQELGAQFGGVAEQATMAGWAGQVQHVSDYFAHCVSHRAFAEAAGLGWRGRHGLIVTPEAGPALRFATLFIPGRIAATSRTLAGCGDCEACIDVCPVLRKGGEYREGCRRRLNSLGLEDEVCGICVRVCWERVGPPATLS